MIFGVAAKGGESFTLDQFDVVMWNLQGLAGHQLLIADLLVVLTAGSSVTGVNLLLPFDSEKADRVDLAGKAGNRQLTTPGFEVREAPQGGTAAPAHKLVDPDTGNDILVSRLAPHTAGSSDIVSAPSDGGFFVRRANVWSSASVDVDAPISAGSTAAIRIRYGIRGRCSAVYWKRSGFGINGGLFDLRLFAPDSGLQLSDNAVLERVVAPHRLSLACVVRATWKVQFNFPLSMEAALLERGRYSDYLGRKPDLRNQGALVAYRITSDLEGDPHGAGERPNRSLFLNVAREFGLLPIGNFLRTGVAVVLGVLFATALQDSGRDLVAWAVGAAASLGVFGLVWKLAAKWSTLQSSARWLKRVFYKFEAWWFKV